MEEEKAPEVTPIVEVTPTPESWPTVADQTPEPVVTEKPEPNFNPATTARFANRAPFTPEPLTEEEAADRYTRLLNTYEFILKRHAFDDALVKMYNDMAGL